MKKFCNAIALVAVAATLTCAGTASAEVFTATFTGTVTNGGDYTGVFGPAGRNLAGLPISTVLTYDTSRGATASSANAVSLTGGSSLGLAAFLVGTRVTIAGVSFDMGGGTTEELTLRSAAYSPGTGLGTIVGSSDYQAYVPFPSAPSVLALQARHLVSVNLSAAGIPANLMQPFTAGPASGLVSVGLIVHDYALANTIVQRADAVYTPSQVVFAAAVPEPQSWALLLLGCGCIAGLLRRRHPHTPGA